MLPVSTPDLRRRTLSPIPVQASIVYGPIPSRRLGRSLGINLLPTTAKVCQSDCVYCQYGSRRAHHGLSGEMPSVSEVAQAVEEHLRKMSEARLAIDAITFSGNGEPTLHPQFPVIVDRVRALRDRYLPQVQIAILSDSTTASRPEIRQALMALDERSMKLDVGSQRLFQAINRPLPGVRWEQMIEGLRLLAKASPVTLQSMFITGAFDNTAPDDVTAWIHLVASIRPQDVHVYTVARPTAEPGIWPVPEARLRKIAQLLAARTGIQATVF